MKIYEYTRTYSVPKAVPGLGRIFQKEEQKTSWMVKLPEEFKRILNGRPFVQGPNWLLQEHDIEQLPLQKLMDIMKNELATKEA